MTTQMATACATLPTSLSDRRAEEACTLTVLAADGTVLRSGIAAAEGWSVTPGWSGCEPGAAGTGGGDAGIFVAPDLRATLPDDAQLALDCPPPTAVP